MRLEKPIDRVNEEDLRALVREAVAEVRTLEYKESLPGGSDGDRREFLADVSSFANAAGGHLIYGVKAASGVPVAVSGVTADPDPAILRMESMIRDGLAPRVLGIECAPIRLSNANSVILVRIPKSFVSPHMVTLGGASRFFSRSSNGKYQLDVDEIRLAFLSSDSSANRVREFRIERISRVRGGETPIAIVSGPVTLLHIIPLASFAAGARFDVVGFGRDLNVLRTLTPLFEEYADNRVFNFDGVVVFRSSHGAPKGYTQLFRSGVVESANAGLISSSEKNGAGNFFPGITFEVRMLRSVRSYLSALQSLGVEPPYLITIDLVGVRGFTVAKIAPARYAEEVGNAFDRDVLSPDGSLVLNPGDFPTQMKTALDSIWNAAGFEGSPFYRDGLWIGEEEAKRLYGGV